MILFMIVMEDAERDFLSRLYSDYRVPMWRYAKAITSDVHVADDIVHSAFVHLLGKADLLTTLNPHQIDAYITITIKREASLYLSKNKNIQMVELADLEIEDNQGQEDIVKVVDRATLEKAMANLPESSVQIIMLRYGLDWPYDEIAATLNITASAARVRHHRAIQQLKNQMKEAGSCAVRQGQDIKFV